MRENRGGMGISKSISVDARIAFGLYKRRNLVYV
jgi:hypothetical protein